MTDSHVVSALKDKRARLDGEIQMRRYQITRLEMELAHVDAVIRMFLPGYDVEKIATKRSFAKNPAGVRKGAGSRQALTVLREAGEPLTCREIARRVLEKQGKAAVPDACGMLAKTIHSTFSRRRRNNLPRPVGAEEVLEIIFQKCCRVDSIRNRTDSFCRFCQDSCVTRLGTA